MSLNICGISSSGRIPYCKCRFVPLLIFSCLLTCTSCPEEVQCYRDVYDMDMEYE